MSESKTIVRYFLETSSVSRNGNGADSLYSLGKKTLQQIGRCCRYSIAYFYAKGCYDIEQCHTVFVLTEFAQEAEPNP